MRKYRISFGVRLRFAELGLTVATRATVDVTLQTRAQLKARPNMRGRERIGDHLFWILSHQNQALNPLNSSTQLYLLVWI